MPRIQVIADDGRLSLDERICAADLSSDHFRRCLVERIGWAVADAQQMAPEPARDGPRAVVGVAA